MAGKAERCPHPYPASMGLETEMEEAGAETKGSPFICLCASKARHLSEIKELDWAVLVGLQIKPPPLPDDQRVWWGREGLSDPSSSFFSLPCPQGAPHCCASCSLGGARARGSHSWGPRSGREEGTLSPAPTPASRHGQGTKSNKH